MWGLKSYGAGDSSVWNFPRYGNGSGDGDGDGGGGDGNDNGGDMWSCLGSRDEVTLVQEIHLRNKSIGGARGARNRRVCVGVATAQSRSCVAYARQARYQERSGAL